MTTRTSFHLVLFFFSSSFFSFLLFFYPFFFSIPSFSSVDALGLLACSLVWLGPHPDVTRRSGDVAGGDIVSDTVGDDRWGTKLRDRDNEISFYPVTRVNPRFAVCSFSRGQGVEVSRAEDALYNWAG